MMVKLLTVILPCLALCIDAALAQCSLAGQWQNDLGSNMTILDISKNGMFWGSYLTAVSATNKTIVVSPLIGYQQLDGLPTFGFTVKWEFSDSITVFTGQCFRNKGGDSVLQTTWLLRSQSQDLQDNWKQTRVGYNTFHPLSEAPSIED